MNNIIEETLLNEISNQNSYFVFPTQISLELWADRIIEISNVTAVAMERFLPWDEFKAESIKSKHQNKKAIPSTLRKFFTSQILQENKKEKFFKKI